MSTNKIKTFKLKKKLGQHLLTDVNVLDHIIKATNINKDITVLEIGPGTGELTIKLAPLCKNIISVEIDNSLKNHLEKLKTDFPNLNIIYNDILKTKLSDILQADEQNIVVANIPYYITSPIIMKLLENKNLFRSIFLTVQKEVAKRVTAKKGSKDFGILTLAVEIEADTEYIFDISKNSFQPPPEVESAFIRIIPKNKDKYESNKQLMLKLIKKSFSQRRKKISNTLKALFEKNQNIKILLSDSGIDPDMRPEDLSLEDYFNLATSEPLRQALLKE